MGNLENTGKFQRANEGRGSIITKMDFLASLAGKETRIWIKEKKESSIKCPDRFAILLNTYRDWKTGL